MVALPRIIAKRWPGAGADVLVNNAGLGRNNAALWDGATASWVEMVSTNVLGVCMCTREALQARPTHAAATQELACLACGVIALHVGTSQGFEKMLQGMALLRAQACASARARRCRCATGLGSSSVWCCAGCGSPSIPVMSVVQ